MIIGILREREPEKRVALTPESVKALSDLHNEILVESNAGNNAFYFDTSYINAGSRIAARKEILKNADCIITVNGLSDSDYAEMPEGRTIIGHLPHRQDVFVNQMTSRKITAFSLDLLPRTSLAQSMDILSSMSTVSGYMAVLEAAGYLPRFFPMFMAASGTIKPAHVLILGAGVAGLQALATAKRLGAVVEVFDVRAAVKEEVHSLGGKFIEVEGAKEDASAGGYAVEQQEAYIKRQREAIHLHAIKSDVIICTAQIPGKKAPLLIYGSTVDAMIPGSVIIDLAAPSGGNCELTKNNEVIHHNYITISGKVDFPSAMSMDASRMYSNNMLAFAKTLIDASGKLNLDMNNEIIKNTCVTHAGNNLLNI
jgi:NAD(P) transhydrogenase subunit alpha